MTEFSARGSSLKTCAYSIAAHIPITASRFGLGLQVYVHSRRMVRTSGALCSSSVISFFQVNSFNSDTESFRKMEHALSEHKTTSSFLSSIPICFRRCLLALGSFRHSTATDCLLPLATAFPMCLRLGVSSYVLGFLYPT